MNRDYWYTLAESNIGTHKMRLRNEMLKTDAAKIGAKYCEDNNLKYIGTYCSSTINDAENNLRLEIY